MPKYDAEMLEKYIAERLSDSGPLTEEEKAAVADTAEFASFCLVEAAGILLDDIWGTIEDAWRNLLYSADAEPSPDAVEVVRCKDCQYLFFKDMSGFCPFSVGPCKPDDFCSYGVRKEG